MTNLNGFTCFLLAATMLSTVSAETHCPGNVESLPLYPVNGHLFVMDVSVNHSGPYKFLLDTGTQFTIVDSALAFELHLSNQGAADVVGAGFDESAFLATLDHIAAGSHALASQDVFVYDLDHLHSIDLHIRGIVGEDFLAHYDMLIDNAHAMLCLDESGAMRRSIKGQHFGLLMPAQTGGGKQLPRTLIVSARLSNGKRPVRLKLDSGTNAAILYNAPEFLVLGSFQGAALHGAGGDGVQRKFASLPPLDVKIGALAMEKVSFLTPAGGERNPQIGEIDGLMDVGHFRRVFIDHADHFAVLEPW
jgi:hypothetical protein